MGFLFRGFFIFMIQIIQNWQKRRVVKTLTISELYDRTINPDYNQKILIETARQYERKSKEQNDIKETLPCFTSAFTFKGYINKANAIRPTGYLYIDVDNIENIQLNHPSIVFYCKSFSGKGYTIIVGVIGLTENNLKEVTLKIASELDIKIDENAISVDRLTVISYDINAYYNANHTYFLFINNELKNPHYNSNIIFNICDQCTGGKIRFSNLDDVVPNLEFDGEAVIDLGEHKIPFFKLNFPMKTITEGERNRILNYLCYYLKALNLHITEEQIFNILNSVNVNNFTPSLDDEDIYSVIESVFRLKHFPIKNNSFRRFIYNPDYNLTTTDKRRINIQRINVQKSEKIIECLVTTIDNWDFEKYGKITQKSVTKASNKNKKTVEKYYKLLKDKIIEKNLAYKNNYL